MLIVEEQKEMAVVIGKVWFAKLPWEKIGTVEKKTHLQKPNHGSFILRFKLSWSRKTVNAESTSSIGLSSILKKTSCAEDFAGVNIDGTN